MTAMPPVSVPGTKRLAVELPIIDSVENSQGLALMESALPRQMGKITPLSEAHLTILYLGVPLSLWSELFPNEKDPRRFLDRLAACVQSILDLSAPNQVSAVGLDVFEHAQQRALVAILRRDPSLLALRRSAWQLAVEMLQDLGLPRAEESLVSSRALSMPDSVWNPHVTLIKRMPEEAPGFTLNLDEPIRLSVGELKIHR